jgi:GTPase SAR1 family protein
MSASTEVGVVILGPRGVGKTSFAYEFAFADDREHTFDPSEETFRGCVTIESGVEVDGAAVEQDVALYDGYSMLRFIESAQALRIGEACLLMYSVTSRESFVELHGMIEEMRRTIEANHIPVVVVGNKCDTDSMRCIAPTEAEAMAASIGGTHMESSAVSHINICESLVRVVTEVLRLRKQGGGSVAPRRVMVSDRFHHDGMKKCAVS